MSLDFEYAKKVSETFDVSTLKDKAVVYSISYLKTAKNRDEAYALVKNGQDFKTLDDTPCGKKLCEIGAQATMDIAPEELKKIWKTASERFIAAASGDLKAFVEGADPRSTFCSIEVPQILKNANIQTINGINKFKFLKETGIKNDGTFGTGR